MTSEKFLHDISNYNNHLVLMWLALESISQSPRVLELGIGYGSTPQLHEYVHDRKGLLWSCDNNAEWVSKFEDMAVADPHHRIRHYHPNWSDADFYGSDWDVVLIDHAPGEKRVEDLLRLSMRAKILVIHDTELPQASQYVNVWPLFKFKADVKGHSNGASSTVVSDKIDVTTWRGKQLAGYEVS